MTDRSASPPLSIVLLIRSLNYGGSERQLVELAKGLQQRGHNVSVAVFYDGGPLLGELRDAGVPVAVLAKRGRWDVVPFLWRLRRFLRSAKPQVVYAFLVEPSVIVTVLKPFLPGTRIVWGVRASNVDFRVYGWFPRITFRLSRPLARFADLIIANSWAGADYHCRLGYPAARVKVVPNGIDLSRFHPDPEAGRRARRAWHITDDRTVIGIVGRLDPMKDHMTFFQAAALVRDSAPQTAFVCVGEGPAAYVADLQRYARTLGLADHVTLVGHQDDMNAAYNALDVCCLTSAFGEGFPNVLGEAIACGVPCVATDVGDASRIMDGCGVTAPAGSADGLARAIRASLQRTSAALKRGCRERAEREFGVGRMVDETERLLRSCVNASA